MRQFRLRAFVLATERSWSWYVRSVRDTYFSFEFSDNVVVVSHRSLIVVIIIRRASAYVIRESSLDIAESSSNRSSIFLESSANVISRLLIFFNSSFNSLQLLIFDVLVSTISLWTVLSSPLIHHMPTAKSRADVQCRANFWIFSPHFNILGGKKHKFARRRAK